MVGVVPIVVCEVVAVECIQLVVAWGMMQPVVAQIQVSDVSEHQCSPQENLKGYWCSVPAVGVDARMGVIYAWPHLLSHLLSHMC